MMKIETQSASRGALLATWSSAEAGGLTAAAFWRFVLFFALVAILWQYSVHLIFDVDYVGPDPDDSMRLVEIRDFLAGQSWFDLTQYRLGPDGGTLMHWSRLIDLPIAALIRFFMLFTDQTGAEALALTLWPLLLIVPLLAVMGLAAYRLGGRDAMVIGLLLTVLLMAAIVRFRPGAIDHHNVQLILAVFITAMLLDPQARFSNFALAGLAGAVGLAVGIETTPLIVVAAGATALLWGLLGLRYRAAAIGFGLSFGLSSLILFVATTPPKLYAQVTCDTLSVGYLTLAGIGGAALAISAVLVSRRGTALRFVALAATGAAVLAMTLLVAPKCLSNPFSEMDPLLIDLWLSSISEAQSIANEMVSSPQTLGGFYAVGLFAIAVAAIRILRHENPIPHAILLALIGTGWLVSAYQIRFGMFANFLAFIPLSALVADLRAFYVSHRTNARAALAFVFSALASLPSVWTAGGVMAFEAGQAVAGVPANKTDEGDDGISCSKREMLAPLAALPPGRVLSTSNPGSALLRFTAHSVLTANYHRNQAGMVAALRIQMAEPANAQALLARYGIDYILLCDGDAQVETMKSRYPQGLVGQIFAGNPPAYLEAVAQPKSPKLQIFKVRAPL